MCRSGSVVLVVKPRDLSGVGHCCILFFCGGNDKPAPLPRSAIVLLLLLLLYSSQLFGAAGPGGCLRACILEIREPGLGLGGGVSGICSRSIRDGWTVWGGLFTSGLERVEESTGGGGAWLTRRCCSRSLTEASFSCLESLW